MSDDNNPKAKKGDVRLMKKYSKTSVRMNVYMEPEERESFKKLQELLKIYAGGRRVSVSILMRRMMNLYTAHLLDLTIAVDQRIEAGALPKSKRKEALAKAMAPEIAALLRAGGHKVKETK